MKTYPLNVGAMALAGIAFASTCDAATIMPVGSFNPNTHFSGGFLAGIDFDDDSNGSLAGNQLVTEPGFASIPPSNNKSYNVTTNGITFDIVLTNANQTNQNRWRNNAVAGALVNDFEQWFGSFPTAGNAVEAKVTISGLNVGQEYDISVFTYNVGAGQTTHLLYDGPSSASSLLGSFSTSGNQNDYNTWNTGTILTNTADANGEIVFTIQATEALSGANYQSRLTLNGISIVPEPSSLALLALGGLCVARRRRG